MTKRILILCAAAFVGCAREPSSGAKLLNPSPDDKARAQEILKQHGVNGTIVALLNADDHWVATVASPPVTENEATKLSMPSAWLVYKDGRAESVEERNRKKTK